MARHVQDLTGEWQFRQYPSSARRMRDLDGEGWLPAQVPSSIYTSLIDAGQIDLADIDAHPADYIHISEKPWIYRKQFDADEHLLGCDRVDLVFDGLDTITQVWLNDKLIGKTDNMFIAHRFDITGLLEPRDNRLLVKFNPAAAHAETLMNRYGKLTESSFGYSCRPYIRKAQYQFGWDWCPALPGCGIFRPVRVEGITAARIEDVHVRTIDCSETCADVAIALQLDMQTAAAVDACPLTCTLQLSGHGQAITQTLTFHRGHDRQSTLLRIQNPELWWPNGYGPAVLYDLDVRLFASDQCIDHVHTRFGIRSVRVNRTPDAQGESFGFEVNQQPVYARGANWIPVTLFAGAQRRADYETLLRDAAAANINMLRVWGGGYYENDDFYDLADELGILIWQDFMFACSYYPDRQWYLDTIGAEAAAVIKRLRNHPSVALWCGNNEIDWLHEAGRLGKGKKFHGKPIYHKLLPALLSELDRERDYIPTTPFGAGRKMNAIQSGTVHQWQIWSGNRPSREYVDGDRIPRFVTEFGLQSLPEAQTLGSFCSADELRIGSRTLDRHNYQLDGNARLVQYTSELFGPTTDLDRFAYLTQLTQARQIKRYVEHLRMHSSVNRGVLFWQYNDCCPAISWSAVDHVKRPKALYYYARRFFAPVCITLSTRSGPRPDLDEALEIIQAVVINDAPEPLTGTLVCRLLDLGGQCLDTVNLPITAQPFSATAPLRLPKALVRPHQPERTLLHLQLNSHDQTVAENHFVYLPDKYVDWPKATIQREFARNGQGQWRVTLTSDVVVRDVQITAKQPARLSDNYVTLAPQQPCTINVDWECDVSHPDGLISLRAVGEAD
ncbi:MAG: glycoside hydrolase family 2 protein [Phycisphaerae bacterium]|nr:glycoside hydrolase family 2 protein [Phycisphaerae bacterium]